MKKLLEFILKNLTTDESIRVEEIEEDNKVTLLVKSDPSLIGLLIGKEGKTIRGIRKVMSIKGTLEGKLVNVNISDETK